MFSFDNANGNANVNNSFRVVSLYYDNWGLDLKVGLSIIGILGSIAVAV